MLIGNMCCAGGPEAWGVCLLSSCVAFSHLSETVAFIPNETMIAQKKETKFLVNKIRLQVYSK